MYQDDLMQYQKIQALLDSLYINARHGILLVVVVVVVGSTVVAAMNPSITEHN